MKLSKNTKKAGLALVGSMSAFLLARQLKIKDYYPYVLLGGFIGSTLGEELLSEECQSTHSLGYVDRNGNLKMIRL